MKITQVSQIYNKRNYKSSSVSFSGEPSISDVIFADSTDAFFKKIDDGVQKIQKEREKEFLQFVPDDNRAIVKKFMNHPGYYDISLLPFFIENSSDSLEYLFNLVSKKDKFGEYRIPADIFPVYCKIPIENLKKYEPIILSQNDLGTWNYEPEFVVELQNFSPDKINLMTELAKYKFHRDCIVDIAADPNLPHDKIIEKAKNLDSVYGKDLREIALFKNSKEETYLTAHIQLPKRDSKPDYYNFKQVFVEVDDKLEPINKIKIAAKTEKLIDNVYDDIINNLALFKEDDLKNILKNIKENVPDSKTEDSLLVLQKLTQFANYSSIKHIGKILEDNNIGRVYSEGELSPVFNYLLMSKSLAHISNKYKSNFALFVTKKDVNNPEFLNRLKTLSKDSDFWSNVRLVNLEGWTDGINLLSDDRKLEKSAIKVLRKTYKVLNKKPKMTFETALDYVLNHSIDKKLEELNMEAIKISLNNEPTESAVVEQMRPIIPSKSIMKSNIEFVANNHTKGIKSFDKLCEKIAKYYKETNNIYSKQNIVNSLEVFNKKLDEYLIENNISKDNVYFIKPYRDYNKPKSFDVILKMYQDMYDIKQSNIKSVKSVLSINKIPEKSAFVILDDFSGTGQSMCNVGDYDFDGMAIDKNKHVIFAPIVITESAQKYIQSIIDKNKRNGIDTIISSGKNHVADGSCYETVSLLPKAVLGDSGYGDENHCTVFPYMAVDNNSMLAGDLTVLFLPTYTCIKNRRLSLSSLKENTIFYDVFGTDKENVMTDSHRAYAPTDRNVLFDKFRRWLKNHIFNY